MRSSVYEEPEQEIIYLRYFFRIVYRGRRRGGEGTSRYGQIASAPRPQIVNV